MLKHDLRSPKTFLKKNVAIQKNNFINTGAFAGFPRQSCDCPELYPGPAYAPRLPGWQGHFRFEAIQATSNLGGRLPVLPMPCSQTDQGKEQLQVSDNAWDFRFEPGTSGFYPLQGEVQWSAAVRVPFGTFILGWMRVHGWSDSTMSRPDI